MIPNMKELIVFLLLMLTFLSESKPLQKVKRAIVKDYFNPLTYSDDKFQFEKTEDGSYQEQKHTVPVISKVEYAIAHGIDSSNELFGETSNPSGENLKNDAVISNTENTSLRPMSFGTSNDEIQRESIELSAKILTANKDKLELKDAMQEKAEISEAAEKLDSGKEPEDTTGKYGTSAKLDIPIDSKWSLVPKLDGKDENPSEGGEVYPEIPISSEEGGEEKKVEIGQIPKHDPVFFPSNIPLIPKRVSFRVLSFLPKSPAVDIMDRLPLPEPEVFEESSETAVVENINPRGAIVRKEGRRFLFDHLISPLRFGLHLPFVPVTKGLKDTVDEEKIKGLVKSEVLDIGGRKMLMQKKVMKSNDNNPNHFHISLMSLQPLEDIDPKILKELGKDKKEIESEETSLKKELNPLEKKKIENRFLKDDGVGTDVKPEAKKGKDVFFKYIPEPEVSDAAEKTKMVEGKVIDSKWSSPEVSVPTILGVEMAKEKSRKEEKEGTTAKEFEGKPQGEIIKESGLKTEIITTSKLDENFEKGKVKEEKEKTTDVVKEEKDVLIGAEDLLKFRNQVKSQSTTSVPPIIVEAGVGVMEGKLGFDSKSKTKDEEAAQSKRIEITLRPVDDSEYNLKKVVTEGKKGDEGMLNAEEIVASQGGPELRESKDVKELTEILKIESKVIAPVLPEAKKEEETAKKAVSTSNPAEKEAKENTDMKIESKEMDDKSKNEKKKGDDGTLNAEDIFPGVKEFAADKEAKEKIDVKNLEHSEKKNPKTEELDLTKTEVPVLEERKRKFEARKDKVSPKKKKCKCEDSDESNSEDDLD